MTSNIATAEPTQQTDPLIINSRVTLAILETDEETTVWIRSCTDHSPWTHSAVGEKEQGGTTNAKTDVKMLSPEEGTEKNTSSSSGRSTTRTEAFSRWMCYSLYFVCMCMMRIRRRNKVEKTFFSPTTCCLLCI